MTFAMQMLAVGCASALLFAAPAVAAPATAIVAATAAAALTPETINAADLSQVSARLDSTAGTLATYLPPTATSMGWPVVDYVAQKPTRSAAVARMEILLDRLGASPGVIDGFDGENLRKAITALELMQGARADGIVGPDVLQALGDTTPVIGQYLITAEDVAAIVPPLPTDYGEMAKLTFLGFTSVPEELAERFHMDQKFLEALNPDIKFVAGDTVFAAITGTNRSGKVTRIEADKATRQVRAYGEDGKLIAAYPATIGSDSTPSPSGTHTVVAVAENPTYTYNPDLNFKQGDNDKVLTIPPGPNGPVGSVWIALSQPTFGIHGTPEPSLIDKAASHGCVRLTNWDAEELAKMVSKGVTVDFLS